VGEEQATAKANAGPSTALRSAQDDSIFLICWGVQQLRMTAFFDFSGNAPLRMTALF
jgi:hypothetical protein